MVCHILIWRLKRPKKDILALALIFMVFPAFIILAGALSSRLSALNACAVILLDWALSAAYIQTYPAAQAVSPSLEIMVLAGRTGKQGISRLEMVSVFDDKKLVHARFEDLTGNRLVTEKPDGLSLTFPGKILARGFRAYRGFLGIQGKGG